MTRLTRLAAVLVVGGLTVHAHAASSAEKDQVLPFTVQLPYGFLFLHMPALPARVPPLHAWSFDAWTTVTNNFIYSDNVGDYLDARTARAPMTRADFDAIAAANPGEDFYYFDGQITSLFARVGTTVAPGFAIGARFSLLAVSRGKFTDGVVEGFHNLFGIGQAYRDVVDRGHTTAAVKIGVQEVTRQDDARAGLGDPILYAMWAPEFGKGTWRVSLIGAVKVPIGSTSKLLSTGSADAGVALALTGDLGRWCVNLNAGVVFPGDIAFFPGVDPVPNAGFAGSVGYRMRRTSLWVQLQWEQSPLREATHTALSDDVYDVSIGMRFPIAGVVRGYAALTENVLAFENSSDIAFHGGVSWIYGAD